MIYIWSDFEVSAYEKYYPFCSILLCINMSILVYIFRFLKLKQIELPRFAIRFDRIVLLFMSILSVYIGYIFAYLIALPILCYLYYLFFNGKINLTFVLVYHLLLLLSVIDAELILDSKELFVMSTIGVVAMPHLVGLNRISITKVIFSSIILAFIFIISQPIVSAFRNDHEILDLTLLDVNAVITIVEIILNRLVIIDALAHVIRNDFDHDGLGVAWSSHTLYGWIFSLLPAFYERPNLAKEALQIMSYSTSSDDVHIAITYLGEYIWSMGLMVGLICMIGFNMIVGAFVKLTDSFTGHLKLISMFAISFIVLRLESLGSVILSRLLITVCFFLALEIIFRILPRKV